MGNGQVGEEKYQEQEREKVIINQYLYVYSKNVNLHLILQKNHIYYYLLQCADPGNEFKFFRNFEKNLIEHWKFFKKSLKLYIKTDQNTKGFDLLPNKCKNMW